METPRDSGRDPVCESIEALLQDLESRGKGSLVKAETDELVVLSFGELQAEAINYDVALVRLASAMMDNEKYVPLLMAALREPMDASP